MTEIKFAVNQFWERSQHISTIKCANSGLKPFQLPED
jgi:hypothetical protein